MKGKNLSLKSYFADYLGMSSAFLCIIHCLAAPFLLVLFSSTHWFELATYLFLALSIYAAYNSTKYQTHKGVKSLIWGGLALLTMAVILEHEVEIMHEVSYFAGALLIGGHVLNIKKGHSCKV